MWSGSAWTTYPGSGDNSGNFTIPNVPTGEYLVNIGNVSYAYTSARTLDLGYELSGRPTAVQETTLNTIGANETNLAAWISGVDDVSWYDPNGPGFGDNPNPQPAAGATSLTSSEVCDWQGALIDNTKGDVLYLYETQYAGISSSAATYTLDRFASFTNVKQVDGTPLTLSGALTTVAPAFSVTVDFRVSQFLALASDVYPGATSTGAAYDIVTQPGASLAGLFGYSTTLATLYANADQNIAVSYGNPFNATWGLVSYASMSVGVPYTAPGASSAATQYGSIFVSYPTSTAVTAVVPTVSPVTSPTINGGSLWTAQTGVGLTPTLAWSAPTTGTPTEYLVSLYQVSNQGGATSITYTTELSTTTTSIVLPPNALASGNTYFVQIEARVSPAINGSTQPYRSSPTVAGADILSATFSP